MSEAITVEDLQARAEAKRALAKAASVETDSVTEWQEQRSAVCSRCNGAFVFTAYLYGTGRQKREGGAKSRFPLATWCRPCLDADSEQRRKISARQDDFAMHAEAKDREEAFRDLLVKAGANAREHGHASFANFDTAECTPKPLRMAREFADAVRNAGPHDPVRGLYLHGDTGPGKTHLAVAVIRDLVEGGYKPKDVLFDGAAELILRIQATYGRPASPFDVLEPRFATGLWVLDDLGVERPSDDVVRHLTVLFTRRAMHPTLVTSNYSPETLEEERPELWRVLSRLGPAYFRVCAVGGRDRRFDKAGAP